jgi:hypothetical protein
MLLVKTVLSISQNRMDQITLNKQLGNHLHKDIINASKNLVEYYRDRLGAYP